MWGDTTFIIVDIALLVSLNLFLVEILALFLSAPNYLLNKWANNERGVYKESNMYSERTLIITSIIMTAVSMYLNKEFINEVALALLVMSTLFLLLSYRSELFINEKRIIFYIQNILFNEGFLLLISGFILMILPYFNKYFHNFVYFVLIILFSLHIWEFVRDCIYLHKMAYKKSLD